MVKRGSYTFGEYQGGYSSLDPNKAYGQAGFTGYRVSAGSIGASAKPDTANQIQEVNKLLNQGMVPIEVNALKPEVFETIPKKHFKELNRMAKLTGSKLSVHAPLIEPSGMGERGWSKYNRELNERQLKDVVERAVQVSDKERVPITIHPSGIPGSEWRPKEGTTGEGGEVEREKIVAFDKERQQPVPIEREERYRPHIKGFEEKEKREKEASPEERLRIQNESKWSNELNQLFFNKDRFDEIVKKQGPHIHDALQVLNKEKPYSKEEKDKIVDKYGIRQGYQALKNAETYLEDLRSQLHTYFDKAWKYTEEDEKQRKQLRDLAERYRKRLNEDKSIQGQSQAVQGLIEGLEGVTPQQFVPIEEFARKQSSQTFSNVALDAYKKSKEKGTKLPMINIENMYTGMAFGGRTEDMNELIKSSKQEFVKKAQQSKNKGGLGLSDSEAKKAADNVIGMTLDLGHLNISKKKGFSEKYLTEQAKKVADQVKHVHIADNFGYSDSHLPPGMGNVPNKELLRELEKQGRSKEMRKIVEAGGFVQHFGISPHPYSLEGMGAPFYQEGEQPYWNQSMGLQQGYNIGYGQLLPQGHFETYGIPSFSNLPTGLGGQRAGAQGSRMSGKPME